MSFYPLFLELAGRACVVIGGGAVAERKVEGLLQVGASVTVVSPALSARLEEWVREGRIRHVGRNYVVGDLAGSQLAFVATDDGQVNAAVAHEGRERGVWVNAADDPTHCDFILPSILRRGHLVIAVGTGGASPALSRAVREELEAYFTEDYAVLAEVAAEVRGELRRRKLSPGSETWQRALDADVRRLIASGRREEAKAHLLDQLVAVICE